MRRQARTRYPQAVFEPFEPRLLLSGAEGSILQIDVHLYQDVGGAMGAEILDDTVTVGESFFVELVAGDIRDAAAGLNALPLDLAWDPVVFEEIDDPFDPTDLYSPLVTPRFTMYRGGTLDQGAGTIDELVGASLPGAGQGRVLGAGSTQRFSLLYFRADAVTVGAGLFDVQLGDSGVSFADGNTIYVPQIESQTITVVVPPNHTPVAQDDAFHVVLDGSYSSVVAATDDDAGDVLTYTVQAVPLHGTLTAFDPATGDFTYEPATNYTGPDSFAFTANDTHDDSNVAMVDITVDPDDLFDVKMGGGRPIVLRYTEADDTIVTIVFAGAGGEATLRFAGTNVAVTSPGGLSQVTGDDLMLDTVALADTTAGNVFVLVASGGADGLATVGTLTSATPVGVINASRTDFIDGGILMTGDGYAGVVLVHSMRDGADIIMPGQGAPAGIVIQAAELSDQTRIELGSHLTSLVAWRWTGGELVAPWAYNIIITGYAWTGIRGDLDAQLTFTGASPWGMALSYLYAAGKIGDVQLLADGGYVGTVVCAQWDDGLLRTTRVHVIQTTGNWFDPQIDGRFGADIQATDANAASSLAAAIVNGQIACDWTFASGVGLIYAQSTADTWTLNAAAGVTNVLVIGRLGGALSALYYTSIYAGGALAAAVTATGANAADMSIVSLSAGVADDISLTAPGGIHVLSLAGSVNTDGLTDTVHAKWITSLVSRGDVDFNLTLTGAAANGYSLVAGTIIGSILGGAWDFSNPEAGNVSSIYATGETAATWRLDTVGFVSSLYALAGLGGAVTAKYINAAITYGDFSADFDLTGQNVYGTSLGYAYAAGNLASNLWEMTGGLGTLVAGVVGGDFVLKVNGVVNLIQVWQWETGRIEAARVNTMMAVSNAALGVEGHFGAEVILTGTGVPAWLPALGYAYIAGNLLSPLWDITGRLGTLYVARAVKGTAADPLTIRSTGSMAIVMAGTFEHANFLAGIGAGVGDHATTVADFADPDASIGMVQVFGNGDLAARFLTGTNFSAASFGYTAVRNADIPTGGLGFYALDSVKDAELGVMVYNDAATGDTWSYSTLWTTPYPGPADFWHVI